jgi:hypothetical protein
MYLSEIAEVIRGWLLAQPWLNFARDWVAGAPAWQILGALSAPIVVLLLAFVLLLMRLGSRAGNGSSGTAEVLNPTAPTVEHSNDPVGAQSPITSASLASGTVAAEMLTQTHPSTPASGVDPTVTSTEPNTAAPEATAESIPSPPVSETA